MKNIIDYSLTLIIFAAITLIGNHIGYGAPLDDAALGMLTLLLIAIIGTILTQLIPLNIPSLAYITLIGMLLTLPNMPTAPWIIEKTNAINLLAITTPIMAYAGISIGRNWADFQKLGWRAFLVASMVFLGTFLGSAIIAEIVLKITGI